MKTKSTALWSSIFLGLMGLLPSPLFASEPAEIFVPSGTRNPLKPAEVKNADATQKKVELNQRQAFDFQLSTPEQKTARRNQQNALVQAIEELIEPARYGYKLAPFDSAHPGKEDSVSAFSKRLQKVEDLVFAGAGNDRIFKLVSRLRDQVNGAYEIAGKEMTEKDFGEQFHYGSQYTRNLAQLTALYYEAVAQKFETNAMSANAIQFFESAWATRKKLSQKERKISADAAYEFQQDVLTQLNRAYRAQLRAEEYAVWGQSPRVEPKTFGFLDSTEKPSIVFVGPVAGEAESVRIYDSEEVRSAIGPDPTIAADSVR